MNANKGYLGWSMSVRAAEAYENGERPKSRWTKKAMLHEIALYVEEYDIDMSDDAKAYLGKLTKDEMFSRFFYPSSWHHTSKYFNATDFYALEEDAVEEYAERPTRRTYWTDCDEKTFETYASAERHVLGLGFAKGDYSYRRGDEYVGIHFAYEEI